LVFAALVFGKTLFSTWLCDCNQQPEGVKTDIVLAREWDEQAIVYTLEVENDQSS
jgi:hypothetical protein